VKLLHAAYRHSIMTAFYVLLGLALGHALVWGLVKRLRSEGQGIKRYQILGFVALKVVLGIFVWASGSWTLFV